MFRDYHTILTYRGAMRLVRIRALSRAAAEYLARKLCDVGSVPEVLFASLP